MRAEPIPVRAEPGDEDGFTLPELLITVLLLGIVSVLLLTTLTTVTRVSSRTQDRNATLADARTALEIIARDLRAANPVNAVTGATAVYDNQVSFSVFCTTGASCTAGARSVTYTVTGGRLDQTTGGATKTLLGPDGTATLATSARRGAIVNATSEPVFTYFDRTGAVIATSSTGGTRPGTYFRDCTKRVRILLKVRSAANTSDTVELTTAVNLRNYNEVNPC